MDIWLKCILIWCIYLHLTPCIWHNYFLVLLEPRGATVRYLTHILWIPQAISTWTYIKWILNTSGYWIQCIICQHLIISTSACYIHITTCFPKMLGIPLIHDINCFWFYKNPQSKRENIKPTYWGLSRSLEHGHVFKNIKPTCWSLPMSSRHGHSTSGSSHSPSAVSTWPLGHLQPAASCSAHDPSPVGLTQVTRHGVSGAQ